MSIELTNEKKKELKELFQQYLSNNGKKKLLSADNRDAFNDFISITFEDEDPEDRKIYKKEVSKYFKSKQEYSEGEEPLSEIVTVRKDHLDISNTSKEHMDSLYTQKMNDARTKEKLSEDNEEIISKMRLICDVSTEVMKTTLRELEKSYNGKGSILECVKECYDEVRDIVFEEDA